MNNVLFLWEVLWVIRAKICNLLTDWYIYTSPTFVWAWISYSISSIKIHLNFELYLTVHVHRYFSLVISCKVNYNKTFFWQCCKATINFQFIGVRSGKHPNGCKSIRMWPKKRFWITLYGMNVKKFTRL